MKKDIFGPFITDFVLSVVCYIVLPVILLTTRIVEIKINNTISTFSNAFILMTIFFYIIYFVTRFVPGMYTIIDAVSQNYVTCKMSYVTGFFADYHFTAHTKKINLRPKKQIANSHYLRVVMADNKGKSM